MIYTDDIFRFPVYVMQSTLITVVPSMMLLIFLVYFFIVWPINKAIGEIKSHAQLIAVFKYIGTKEDDPRRRISDDMVQYHVPDTIKGRVTCGIVALDVAVIAEWLVR
jgi:cytochrome oxidase Cu insertion factor (SCO1/SenC/PrrC family)